MPPPSLYWSHPPFPSLSSHFHTCPLPLAPLLRSHGPYPFPPFSHRSQYASAAPRLRRSCTYRVRASRCRRKRSSMSARISGSWPAHTAGCYACQGRARHNTQCTKSPFLVCDALRARAWTSGSWPAHAAGGVHVRRERTTAHHARTQQIRTET